ncbi:MAG: polysaccharide biosynthesis protein [Opitutales bacterium]|nr:polysaccharide biosynthesis protein [Opitutales bacterium]
MANLLNSIKVTYRRIPAGRGLVLTLCYTLIISASYYLSFLLRFDFSIPKLYLSAFFSTLPALVALELALLYVFGQFSILLSYFRIPDLYRISMAMLCATLIQVIAWYVNDRLDLGMTVIPRGVIMSNFIMGLMLLCCFRVLIRIVREKNSAIKTRSKDLTRVAIIGAGDVGSQLAAEMMAKGFMKMRPVIFLDDDNKKWRRCIHSIPVVGSPDELPSVKKQYGIESVIIAMPSASTKRVRDIVDMCNEESVTVHTVPSMEELATGKVSTTKIRQVQIEDLLGRKEVSLDTDNIKAMIAGRIVMVTGAGGSIGSELVVQIASYGPKQILLVERSEIGMFSLEARLKELNYENNILPIVVDICDLDDMRAIMGAHKPELIFHAAAYKHVPIMERQPATALLNNSFGTANLAEMASEFGVERFVLISTDKAINPTNAMGASKRLAEIYIQSLNFKPGNKTRFMAVRFGNVLNSSGSVIPTFRKQIEEGGPVTVTHPEVTRYFMTIPEAVGLVLQCGTLGEGGEIFVLNMGTPVKIVDMARQMIRMSGLRPDLDIDIKFVGLRPGEKLYEELRHNKEQHAPTKHGRIFRFACNPTPYDVVCQEFSDIYLNIGGMKSANEVRMFIKRYVPEYTPYIDQE